MERDNVQKSEQRQAIALFAVVVLASSVGNLAQTGLNAMLSSICAEFGIVEGVGQWLTTSYMLVLGIVVPLSSYFMGRFRLKDLTLLAIALFAVGALVSAAASNFAMLFAGRLAQAVAAGMLLPLVQTIAMTRFPDGRKATAMGISGIAMGFAPNIGPTIGGAMVESLGWRSFFWLLVALTVFVGIACQFAVKRRDDASYPASFDVLSFVLSALGFGGLLMGASEVSSYSFIHPFVWAPLIAGAVCLFAFAKRQRSLENPLVDLAIFDNREFVDGFWALNCLFASFMGITLLVPLYIEGLCGGSAMQAGLGCRAYREPACGPARRQDWSATRHAVFRGVPCCGFVPYGHMRRLDAFVGRVRHARRAFDGRFRSYWSAYRVELIGAPRSPDFRRLGFWHRRTSSMRLNRLRRHGVLRLRRRIGGRGGLPCRIRAFRRFFPCLLRDYRPARKISERALQ